MTITNHATAQLRLPGAPMTAADVDINRAIVEFVRKTHGGATFKDIGEVFLPAAAAGCNSADVIALGQRLTFLVAAGHLQRTVEKTHWRKRTARYFTPHYANP